jgi:hypothetical protein
MQVRLAAQVASKVEGVRLSLNYWGEMSNRTESYAKAETLARQAF